MREGVRRYGFHGLSYEYVADRLREIAPDRGERTRHRRPSRQRRLDVRDRRRPQRREHDGIHRARRPADGNAAGPDRSGRRALSADRKGHEPRRRFRTSFTSECGLKGLSGISNDVRELLESDSRGAALALDHFVYRIGLYAGHAGGGARRARRLRVHRRASASDRRYALAHRRKLAWLGAELDPEANAAGRRSSYPAATAAFASTSCRPTKN